ncbi:MAG TPA: tRNA pseudouridine(38-40) synthase TruA [Holophagaceae bacterium]|nr:tRNA pseudouridine(38-40) synthase TruA [Holophagaceae bacterium]
MQVPHFLTVAYVGTSFSGWQVQSVLPSVQGTLWDALRRFHPEAPLPQGTGRTDAGVHARAQGVLVLCPRIWEGYRLLAAFNAFLPPEIRVMSAQQAPEGFHPRHHAVAKRYTYRLMEGPAQDPFERGRRWHHFGAEPLDRAAMAEAAAHLVGTHDFSSFRNPECVAKSPVRSIYAVTLREDGPRMDLEFEGNRFLMHQVRIMAGTVVEAGRRRLAPAAMPEVLAARSRAAAGPTAPPEGLWLEKVWYQARWGIGEPCPWGESEALGSGL